MEAEAVVIGAGIVGTAVAAHLAEAGLAPVVIDRTGICMETSAGNAGALAFSDVLPLAQKGLARKIPGWLADPLGPLAIPPAALPGLLPWLVRFWRAGRPDRFQAAVSAQAALMGLAEAEWSALIARAGIGSMVHADGSLELYEGAAEFEASLPGWAARDRFGIAYRHIAQSELAALQPGLSEQFTAGTFVPGWKTVSDPQLFGTAVWRHAERHGATFRQAEVGAIRPAGERLTLELSQGARLTTSRLVIAAGAWSHQLARHFGDRIPLQTERGYNTTLPLTAFDVKRQLIFGGHGFVITPLSTGIRVGGAVELAGLRRPPNFARAAAMLEKAKRFLPGLDAGGGRQWMGFRPSLPDSLPVIGRSRTDPRVHYAFGHGHLGLTQAAASGRLIADAILGHPAAIDPTPFSAQRF
jgi:D-amino-acid dehydrogenase